MIREFERLRPGLIVPDREVLVCQVIELVKRLDAGALPAGLQVTLLAAVLSPYLVAAGQAAELIQRIRTEGPRYPLYVLHAAWAIMEAQDRAKGLIPPADAWGVPER